MADEEDVFLIVLIDEVESLTAARAGAMSGQEPSDALRVVNALLTQLDRMRKKKNVLFMSTSNLVGAIGQSLNAIWTITDRLFVPPM
jgi:pachytene checkpoint protein 2